MAVMEYRGERRRGQARREDKPRGVSAFALALAQGPFIGVALSLLPLSSPCADGFDLTGFTAMDGASAGTTSLPWLRLPVGARNAAMGGRGLTTDEEATAQIANPASVALAQHTDYALSHAEILGEFRMEHLSLAMPWRYGGNLGVTVGALFAGTFENARDIDENPAQPAASDMAAGLAFGRNFFDQRLALGARIDLYRSAIEEVSGYGGGLGLGLTWRLGADWRMAMALRHLGPGVAYGTPTGDWQSQPMLWNIEWGKPLALDLWSLQAGLEQEAGGVLRYYAGGEWLFKDLLLFRLGYEGTAQQHELGPLAGLSAGLGARWEALTVDYGFREMGLLGAYHSFGLSYTRKLKDRRNDEFLLREARATYAQGNYHRALKLTRKALEFNPRNYKAQAFLSLVLADLERLDDHAVSLLFTANTRGHLAPQWIEGKPLGGLARRAAKLKELRQSYPHHVLVDAGDLLTATTKAETQGFLAGAYAHMDYDAIGTGPQEASRGDGLLGRGLPFVATQKNRDGLGADLPEIRVKKMSAGIRVVAVSVTLGGGAAKSPGGTAMESAEAALGRVLADIQPKDLLVVLAHGTLQGAYLLAQKLERIDVMVLSGESGAMQVPMKAGRTFLVCPGSNGMYLGQLSFVFDKEGKIRSHNHRLIPLDSKVQEDQGMARLLSAAIVDLNKTLTGDGELELTAKALPFIDDSADVVGRLHLLDLITGKTYPVPTGGLPVADPAVAWGRNRLAFTHAADTGARELFSLEPGRDSLDTLTRHGGSISQQVYGLRGKALFARYALGDASDLVRIDPWRHEMNNLTQGRMGQVQSLALSPQQDQLIFAARLGESTVVTLSGSDLSMPVEIARVPAVPGRMVWSPDGERFAFLRGEPGDSTGEIQVYDTRMKGLITLTGGSAVHEMAFSADSRRLYFSAGRSVADINVAHLDSLTLRKATLGGHLPRSERFPIVRSLDGKEKLLFLAEDRQGRRILMLDPLTQEEREWVAPRPGLRFR